MKKTYITPNLGIIKVKAEKHLLAGSMGTDNTPHISFDDALDGNEYDDAD